MAMNSSHSQRNNPLLPRRSLFTSPFKLLFILSSFSRWTASTPSEPSPIITSTCRAARYREACRMALSSHATGVSEDPTELFRLSVKFTHREARSARLLLRNLSRAGSDGGLDLVLHLIADSLEQLKKVLDHHRHDGDGAHTWLSAAVTNQETCATALRSHKFGKDDERLAATSVADNLFRFTTNSLALFVTGDTKNRSGGGDRRLLGFPEWVGAAERRLMEAPAEEIEAHAVVAKDGTGTHGTVREAIEAGVAAAGGQGRAVIYVKAGTYTEANLNIPARRSNVMLVGDGKGRTVITGSKSNSGGYKTIDSATFAVYGDGFMARDVTFANTAGPGENQAVALRVASDRSVFFRCSIEGYQDTLYSYSKRQFYRDSDISGTVDFIFGNAAAVFQGCNLFVRTALPGRSNYVTAQGRLDPNQNTGFSIHNCRITAAASGSRSPTYLGRPWRPYSRTVVMQSFLGDVVEPAGWAPWGSGSGLTKVFYGEYMNSGPGSGTSGRVRSPGYRPALALAEAQKFTVDTFISGNQWLPTTGVTFDSGLI